MGEIKLSLNEAEQQAYMQLLDIALRKEGLAALNVATLFTAKLQAAQAQAATEKDAADAAAIKAARAAAEAQADAEILPGPMTAALNGAGAGAASSGD